MARSFLGQGRWEVEGSVEARMGQALQAVAALPVEPIRGRTKDVYFYDDANFFGGA